MKTIATLTAAVLGAGLLAAPAMADEIIPNDQAAWQESFMKAVKEGRALFTDPTLGGSKNGVVCAQCHPNASNTHPETYPKFQQQLGLVVGIRDMINWCIQNPLEGAPLDTNGPEMLALEAYIAWERRGVALAPGKH